MISAARGSLMCFTTFLVHQLVFHCRMTNMEAFLVPFRVHQYSLTSSSSFSWVFGWRQARSPSKSLASVTHSCRLTPRLLAMAPWLRPTHSWWTWAPPPRTHLHPARCGDGGGDGGDVHHPGPPPHPVAPFSPAATVVSCWPHPRLIEEESDLSQNGFYTTVSVKSTALRESEVCSWHRCGLSFL